ncbi:outer membrane protein assembly factor BamC [Halotalea alkalilenta]|uniref:outer membrane protein assembly factor BamC n=1 Tax=Halotalea alkalilenta TaxID=376489 RepID=UPI0005B95115|nr:outer membrane protein assembly factor BamC [Halotalea alkalilenta]
MIRQRTLFVALPLTLLLGGCGGGYFHDRNYEYIDAEMAPPLELPATRDANAFQDAMPVPDASSGFVRPSNKFQVPRPEPMGTASRGAPVEVREANGQRWLVVQGTPSSVWPRLTEFASSQGLEVQSLEPAQGRIVTSDVTLALRQGLRANTTEVYCLAGNATDDACVTALERHLATGASSVNSMAGQGLSQGDRVRLDAFENNWRLLIALDYPRAWSELAYQLGESFDSDDRRLLDHDQQSGEMRIRFHARAAQSSGWFSWFSRGATADYRLHVVSLDSQRVGVTVSDDQGNPVPEAVSREILEAVAGTLR